MHQIRQILVGLLFGLVATGVNAAYIGTNFTVFEKGDPDYPTTDEVKVYVEQDAVVPAGTKIFGSLDGNTFSQDAYWVSKDPLAAVGNGWAIIKGDPAAGGWIYDVTFGLVNNYFGDVIFDLLPEGGQGSVFFDVEATFADTTVEKLSDIEFGQGLTSYLALAADEGNPFKEIHIIISADLELLRVRQIKQWMVSDITPVPIPGAVWLFGSALVGLAGLSRGRKLAA